MTKAYKMPVNFLRESGKDSFVQNEGYALALREELRGVVHDPAFYGAGKGRD